MQQGFFSIQQTCPTCRGSGKSISDPCTACHGQGRVEQTKELKVKVPGGVDEGDQIRLSGEGEAGENAGPHGDLYVQIRLKPHSIFKRDGDDLYCEMPVSFATVTLGGELEVPTLEGRGEVEIPAGTQSGQVFRMNGKGMPDPRRRGLGDLLVQVVIEVPKKLSKEEQVLLRELAELEHKHVAPERKGFFEKLKDYFTTEGSDHE
jgi:molecular chaperone DnaJ